MEKVNNKKVEIFWDWFRENQSQLIPDIITSESINLLNKKILDLGDFNWEIREGNTKSNMLIISPGGDPELLESTQLIIKAAPKLDNWEYAHFKPAKTWDFKVTIDSTSRSKKTIDVQNWEYILLGYSDASYDILIKADNLKKFRKKEMLTIADIVLESILGEELSLKLINNVEFLEDFTEADRDKKNSIKVLREHLIQLTNGN